MKSIETDFVTFNALVEIEQERTYASHIREEDFHGTHIFIDQDIISEEVVKVTLKVDGNEIDITSRLTKEELSLLNIYYDEVELLDEHDQID